MMNDKHYKHHTNHAMLSCIGVVCKACSFVLISSCVGLTQLINSSPEMIILTCGICLIPCRAHSASASSTSIETNVQVFLKAFSSSNNLISRSRQGVHQVAPNLHKTGPRIALSSSCELTVSITQRYVLYIYCTNCTNFSQMLHKAEQIAIF